MFYILKNYIKNASEKSSKPPSQKIRQQNKESKSTWCILQKAFHLSFHILFFLFCVTAFQFSIFFCVVFFISTSCLFAYSNKKKSRTISRMEDIYQDVQKCAVTFVDEICEKATQALNQNSAIKNSYFYEPIIKNEINILNDQMKGPSIKYFTVDEAKGRVNLIINSWMLGDDWVYSIRIQKNWMTAVGENFKFQVIFSLPTPAKPIPEASASVIFLVSKIWDNFRVIYNFEGFSYEFEGNDGNSRRGSQEFILNLIIDNKLKMFKNFDVC